MVVDTLACAEPGAPVQRRKSHDN